MTTITIDLPDQQAAALQAKAAAQGLSLEGWFRKLADAEAPSRSISAAQGERPRSLVEEARELRRHVKADPEGWTVRDYVTYGRR